MERFVLGKNPALKKVFSEAQILFEQPLVISQVSFSSKTMVEGHLLMIGDAAGMITPLCGNGMSMALHGSKIAYNVIDNFLQGVISRLQMEKDYEQLWNDKFARRLMVGRGVQRFFGGASSTTLFLKMMKAFPFLSKNIIRLTHGEPF